MSKSVVFWLVVLAFIVVVVLVAALVKYCEPRKTPSEIAPPGYFDWLHNKPSVLPIEIAKLELKPGDILVVKTDVKQCTEDDFHMRRYLRDILPPGTNIVILPAGMSLQVAAPAPVDPAPVEGG